MAKVHPRISESGVFVGKQTYVALSEEDQVLLQQCTTQDWPEQVVASQFRSIFMPAHGYRGLLYRVGEFALVKLSTANAVVKVADVFCARSNSELLSCIKGEVYPYKENEAGEVERHPYSDSAVVVPSSDHVIVLTTDLLRKVMLYPDPDNLEDPSFYVTIDYLRQDIPLESNDVLVPFFPEKEDMVLIVGDDSANPWLANVRNVDTVTQTCQIHFYVETHPGSHHYQRESAGRRTLETVQWASIIGKASGRWNATQWIIT